MAVTALVPMVGDGPNRFLVESLSHINQQVLCTEQIDFRRALGLEGQREVFCFYETMTTPTPQLVFTPVLT